MPRPKKTDRTKKRPETTQDLQHDHEQFLLAFEKPTQIYRFLRARQILAPTFLHRTLLYMPQRCSRTNARRKKFSVKDMLMIAQTNEANLPDLTDKKNEDLHVSVTALLLDPSKKDASFLQGKKQPNRIDVEVVLVRVILNKRKDLDCLAKETSYGVIEVPVNPRVPAEGFSYIDDENCSIVIPVTDLVKSDCIYGATKSLSLKLRIRQVSSDSDESENSVSADSDEQSSDDGKEASHPKKKRKTGELDEDDEEEDPAGISLKNLQTGPRKRRSRYSGARASDQKSEEDERNTRSKDPKVDSGKTNCKDARAYSRRSRPPVVKRNSGSSQEILSEIELLLFNGEFECQSATGDYELVAKKKESDKMDYKRKAVWESFNGGDEVKVYGSFSAPTLKFSLKWAENSNLGPLADRAVEGKKNDCNMFGSSERCTRTARQNFMNDEEYERERILTPVDLIEYRKCKLQNSSQHLGNGLTNGCDNGSPSNRVFYQFMYNNNTQQQTESRDDFICPWCQLNCMALYGLMKHLKLCHPRFLFRYSQLNKGTVIIVTVNECYDGSYAGNPRNIFCQPGMAFSRRGPVRRIPVTDVLVYKPERKPVDPNFSLAELLDKEDIEALEPTQMSTGHRRLYFHSLTTLPVRPCEFDMDSEEENTEPDWLFGHTKRMIDEFTDVNEGEKALMKLWNLHVMRNSCISDVQVEDECKKFIDENISHLTTHSLRRNLLLHFVCLVDFGVFKTSSVLTLMEYFDAASDKYKREEPKLVKKLSPDVASADFPEPDLLPRIEKLKALVSGANN